jgi:hypothetical protein
MMHARAFLVVCFALCFSCSSVSAQTINEVLAHRWRTVDTLISRENDDKQMIIEQFLDSMLIDSRNNYTASGKTVVTIAAKKYITRYQITGRITIKLKKKLVLLTYDEQTGNTMIAGETFCPCRGEFQLYSDSDRPGKFFLEGSLIEQCGSRSLFTRFFD